LLEEVSAAVLREADIIRAAVSRKFVYVLTTTWDDVVDISRLLDPALPLAFLAERMRRSDLFYEILPNIWLNMLGVDD
jgi:hypothetical protein